MRPDTLLVHAGEPRPRDGGAVAMPIYQSSTFEETEARGYHDIRYARLSNTPTAEALTNPLLRVADHPAAAAFARERDLVSIIDNTFATPLAFRPLRHRFDLVLHSATKYLNGHSDVIAGAVMGSAARVREVKRTLDHLGGSLDPHACFLLQRGLKTLGVRYRQQCATSLAVAKFLEKQ